MCPKARLLLGRATAVDLERRTVTVQPVEGDPFEEGFDTLVVALGAIARTAPVPASSSTASASRPSPRRSTCETTCSSSSSWRRPSTTPAERRRRLTFVFVGGGYAGVEAMAELEDLVRDASRHYPSCATCPAAGSWPTPPTTS